MLFCLLAGIISGVILMTAVYSLPVDPMISNVARAEGLYAYEGIYPQWAYGYSSSQLDNCTDTIMLMDAIHPVVRSPLYSAMMNYRMEFGEALPQDSLMIQALHRETSLTPHSYEYPRYWHGYLLFLKPLLLKWEVSDLRYFNMFLQFSMAMLLMLLLDKKLGHRITASMTAVLLVLNPVSIAMSFQFSTMYYITLCTLLLILWKDRSFSDKGTYPFVFLFAGIATSFFDFLTYPVISLGLPLCLVLLLGKDLRVRRIFTLSCSWGLGYAGMWSGKWIAAYLLTGYNVLQDALSRAEYYSSGQTANKRTVPITFLNALTQVRRVFTNWPFLLLLLCFLFATVYLILHRGYHFRIHPRKTVPFLLTALIPFMWVFVTKGHTMELAWFTYRNFSVTLFAFLCIWSQSLTENVSGS